MEATDRQRAEAGQKFGRILYGLPCANCLRYYPASLDACPLCHHRERVAACTPELTAASRPIAS
jgi:rRNA maturation endonuclease Nob1